MRRVAAVDVAAAVTAGRRTRLFLLLFGLDLAPDDLVEQRRVVELVLAVSARPRAARVTEQAHPVTCHTPQRHLPYTHIQSPITNTSDLACTSTKPHAYMQYEFSFIETTRTNILHISYMC